MSSVAPVGDRAAGDRSSSAVALEPARIRGLHLVSHDGTPAVDAAHDIAARIRAGDARALQSLFREYYTSLCDFAVRYVREESVAEDLVQDLFSDLWARRGDWTPRESVRAYLFSAVRNRALNLRKRQAVERDWERDETVSEVPTLHLVAETTPDRLEREELSARVAAAMESLPERCRLVMHLRWRERLPHAEIAAVMGISVKGVEMQLSRGLKALRLLLR
jgi:RNA polymerase sigma-70 factor (ECF subfamily)